MRARSDTRLGLVFGLLTGVTLLSWWLGTRNGGLSFSPNALITIAVVLISALKVRVIVWEFMELRHAPAMMRRCADTLLTLLVILILALYAYGRRIAG
jgi:hypothetical protein